MFIDKLEVHNNTMVKIQLTWHTYNTNILPCQNVSICKFVKKNRL